jgi:LCP family protein required for cell wall assembly
MTILAVGSDTRSNSYLYGLADVIRLVRVDFVTMRVTILEFPRDFWVEIPEVVKKRGYTHGKLNQAYFFGNPGMGYYDGPGQGPGLLARTLDYNFGARADHYLAINMRTFEKVIDAVGGIDLYLPYTVDARKKDQPKRMDLYFEAGYHHLNGQSALMLARIRQYTVFGRASNQNLVLCALRDQFVTPYVFPQIPAIVEAFKGSVQTDLTPEQISQLACLASKKSQMKIVFAEFPQSVMTPTRVYDPSSKLDLFIFDVDNSVIRGYVANFMNGTWPEITADIGTPSASGMNAAVCP